MDFPIVLVFSNGSITTNEIISNIRNMSTDEKQISIESVTGFFHTIKTKYYETEIVLLPLNSIAEIPETCKDNIEGILIYFDANDRSFLDLLPTYTNFINDKEIEFCVLLCDVLEDDSGISFKELKETHKVLDIIELGRKLEEDEEEDPYNPIGYDELAQALRSVVWSNVNINKGSVSNGNPGENNGNSQEDLSENDIENEFEDFEKLLSQVIQFRPNTQNMNRNERLTYAQQFAEVFEKLILADEDNPLDDGGM